MEPDINWEDVTRLEVIGLDEISLKKGHRDFVAIIPGRLETETVILGVLPDRKKATVKALLSGIPQRVRQTIHSVCAEMYEGFVDQVFNLRGYGELTGLLDETVPPTMFRRHVTREILGIVHQHIRVPTKRVKRGKARRLCIWRL